MYLKTNILTIKTPNGGSKDKITLLNYHIIVKDKFEREMYTTKEGKKSLKLQGRR